MSGAFAIAEMPPDFGPQTTERDEGCDYGYCLG